jgi:hypothetical protein
MFFDTFCGIPIDSLARGFEILCVANPLTDSQNVPDDYVENFRRHTGDSKSSSELISTAVVADREDFVIFKSLGAVKIEEADGIIRASSALFYTKIGDQSLSDVDPYAILSSIESSDSSCINFSAGGVHILDFKSININEINGDGIVENYEFLFYRSDLRSNSICSHLDKVVGGPQ